MRRAHLTDGAVPSQPAAARLLRPSPTRPSSSLLARSLGPEHCAHTHGAKRRRQVDQQRNLLHVASECIPRGVREVLEEEEAAQRLKEETITIDVVNVGARDLFLARVFFGARRRRTPRSILEGP